MTRKQALALAIQVLIENGTHEAAVETLRTLSDELPLDRWTDAAIRDAVEQFILDRGRPPTVTDFKRRGLPPHTVIRNRYGVSLREWLDAQVPAVRPSDEAQRAALTEAFREEYLRLRPTSAKGFDRQRRKVVRCWYTVAARNSCHTWRELLTKLHLPVYAHDASKTGSQLTVKVVSDLELGGKESKQPV
ncbi:MAG: hypothetical protein IJR65_03650 [Oscillospiraceae bacterium]|nr:hypothetical protein [Oscillospiraceae bacterium]